MLTEAGVPDSDDWWLFTLATTMGADFPRLEKQRRYREGDALLPEGAAMTEAAKRFFQMGRLHMADLIVQAKTSRQRPLGFRTAADNDDLGDDLAYATWKRSGMTIRVRSLFDDVGHYGRGYLLNDDGDEQGQNPEIHVLTPWECYAEPYAARPWLTEAAVWVRHDPKLGQDRITLFRAGYMRTAIKTVERTTIRTDGKAWKPGTDWTWEGAAIKTRWSDSALHDRTGVTIYEAPDGVGFYEKHIDTLDRINDGIKQRITIAAMQAFKQRAIKGELPAVYPDNHPTRAGEEIDYNEVFSAGPAALWLLGADNEIWESASTDITPLLTASRDDIKHLAAVTATPLYVLQPEAASGSASGADLARETLVFAVRDLNERADYAFAEAHGIAFAVLGDERRADPGAIETIWAAVSQSSITERSSAASQAAAGGLPQDLIDELVWELTPQQRRRAQQARSDASFLKPPAPDPVAPVEDETAPAPVEDDEQVKAA